MDVIFFWRICPQARHHELIHVKRELIVSYYIVGERFDRQRTKSLEINRSSLQPVADIKATGHRCHKLSRDLNLLAMGLTYLTLIRRAASRAQIHRDPVRGIKNSRTLPGIQRENKRSRVSSLSSHFVSRNDTIPSNASLLREIGRNVLHQRLGRSFWFRHRPLLERLVEGKYERRTKWNVS